MMKFFWGRFSQKYVCMYVSELSPLYITLVMNSKTDIFHVHEISINSFFDHLIPLKWYTSEENDIWVSFILTILWMYDE